MAITYSRYHVFVVDSFREANERIARAHSLGSVRYDELSAQFEAACLFGDQYPWFEDGGSLIELRPSPAFSTRLARDMAKAI